MVRTLPIENLELALGGLEPFDRFALENCRELALGIRVELLHRVQAAAEATEQIFRHVALVGR